MVAPMAVARRKRDETIDEVIRIAIIRWEGRRGWRPARPPSRRPGTDRRLLDMIPARGLGVIKGFEALPPPGGGGPGRSPILPPFIPDQITGRE